MSTVERGAVGRFAFDFTLRDNDVIRGDVWSPAHLQDPSAAIAVCHGFKGFKDWGFFPHLCESLADRTGVAAIGFNFSGSGIGDDPQTFTELEKFGHNTFTRELEDVHEVMRRSGAFELEGLAGPIGRFGLFGHSRGGAAAIITAAERDDVRAVATWAAIASVERYEAAYADELAKHGVVIIPNARTGQQMPLYPDIVEDIRANGERLDMLAAAERLTAGVLIVHGDADITVPVQEARLLAQAAGKRARLEIIPGAGHTMGSVHPFLGPGPDLERAVSATADHFRTHLLEAT